MSRIGLLGRRTLLISILIGSPVRNEISLLCSVLTAHPLKSPRVSYHCFEAGALRKKDRARQRHLNIFGILSFPCICEVRQVGASETELGRFQAKMRIYKKVPIRHYSMWNKWKPSIQSRMKNKFYGPFSYLLYSSKFFWIVWHINRYTFSNHLSRTWNVSQLQTYFYKSTNYRQTLKSRLGECGSKNKPPGKRLSCRRAAEYFYGG